MSANRFVFTLVTLFAVMLSAAFSAGAAYAAKPNVIVYVCTNNPNANKNAILAYHRENDGSLTLLASYATEGTGVGNPGQIIGPNDADRDLIVSADKKFLYCVNPGSDTIAVFRIDTDGLLTKVPGSPFACGGSNPVSLALVNGYLYVVNKSGDPARATTVKPNYTVFKVANNGALAPLANSTVEIAAGSSPAIALPSPDGSLLFGTQLFGGALDVFKIKNNGKLAAAPGSPLKLPVYTPPANAFLPDAGNLPLNAAIHPTFPVLYVNFVTYDQIGVYVYDDKGELTFLRAIQNSGAAPCWSIVDPTANWLYVTDAFDNSVSTYSLDDPLDPTEVFHLSLTPITDQGNRFGGPAGAFRLALESTNKYLYVLDQRITTDAQIGAGNILHVLAIGNKGRLVEVNSSPVTLPVPKAARPQGIVTVNLGGDSSE